MAASNSTSSSDQSANAGTSSSADQNAAGAAPASSGTETAQNSTGNNANNLPQTASPLPFLGLLGLGSLAAGLVTRRK